MSCPNYRLGMRAVKTALAIFLSLVLCKLLVPSGMLFAAIASVICMQQTLSESLKTGLRRLVSTGLGSVAAFVVLQLATYFPQYKSSHFLAIVPLGALLTIYLSLLFNQQEAVALSVVVFLCITLELDRTVTDSGIYVIQRYFGTLLGVASAGVVNRVIAPYKGCEEENK